MSQRDRLHTLEALSDLSGGEPGVAVAIADVERKVGRGRGDMRTPLELRRLVDDGHAVSLPGGAWALTEDGAAWLKRDRELSDR